MIRTSALLVGCLGAMLAGCTRGMAPAVPVLQQRQWPTSQRPIVLNEIDRGGGLIFGGEDGRLRQTLANGDAYARYALSPNARHAACISYDWKRTRARWVTFFDCSGSVVANVMLPAPPATRVPMVSAYLQILLSDRDEAVVEITQCQYYEGPVRQEPLETTFERCYVLPEGTVKPIPGDRSERVSFVFPRSDGLAILRADRKGAAWRIERYDRSLQLLWTETVEADHLFYAPARAENGIDFALYRVGPNGQCFMLFRRDGSFDEEPIPQPVPPSR